METRHHYEARSAPSSYPTAKESALSEVLRVHFADTRGSDSATRRILSTISVRRGVPQPPDYGIGGQA